MCEQHETTWVQLAFWFVRFFTTHSEATGVDVQQNKEPYVGAVPAAVKQDVSLPAQTTIAIHGVQGEEPDYGRAIIL